jgi:hypothetical protein
VLQKSSYFSHGAETVPDTSDRFYGIKWAITGTNKEYLVNLRPAAEGFPAE